MKNNIYFGLSVWMVVLVVFVSYSQGISGPFLLDDGSTLSQMSGIDEILNLKQVKSFVFRDGLALGRPLSKLSFLVDDFTWPTSPSSFKYTNILLHLLCGLFILFFFLNFLRSSRVSASVGVSFTVFLLWVLSPYNISTTLYVVQRMTQLSSLFMVIGLLGYVIVREKEFKSIWINILISYCLIGVFGVLSILSKPIGATLLVYIFAIELSGVLSASTKKDKYFKRTAILSGAVFCCAFFYQLVIHLPEYASRSFDWQERIAWQGKILFEYINGILIPSIGNSTVFHDDKEYRTILGFVPSFSWWLIHLLIMGAAFFYRKKAPIVLFGVMWFYCGHILESTFIPLELKFEHRNYLPSLGLYAILAYLIILISIWLKENVGSVAAKAFYMLPILVFLVVHIHTSRVWGNPLLLSSAWSSYKEDSIRTQNVYVGYIEVMGGALIALDAANKFSNHFEKDITFSMRGFLIACDNELSFENVEHIFYDDLSGKIYDSGILYLIEEMIKPSRLLCVDKLMERSDFENFLERVGQVKLHKEKKRHYAVYLKAKVNYYKTVGDFNKTITVMLELLELQPTVDMALETGDLFYSAGLYGEALVNYKKAEVLDKRRPYGVESRINQIKFLIHNAEIIRAQNVR